MESVEIQIAGFGGQGVILAGMAAAVVLRIGLALVAVDLLNVLGLTLAGGIVLGTTTSRNSAIPPAIRPSEDA